MRLVIAGLALVLAAVVFVGWNQIRERNEREHRDAEVAGAAQKEEFEKRDSERRNRESARKSAEAEKKLQDAGF